MKFTILSCLVLVGCASSRPEFRSPASKQVCGMEAGTIEQRIRDCNEGHGNIVLVTRQAHGHEYYQDRTTKLIWQKFPQPEETQARAEDQCRPWFERWPGDTIGRDNVLKNLKSRLPTVEELRELFDRGTYEDMQLEGWVWTAEKYRDYKRSYIKVHFPRKKPDMVLGKDAAGKAAFVPKYDKIEFKEDWDTDSGKYGFRCVSPAP